MAGTQSDARFWDKTARKYAASTVSDPDGYERTLERTRAFLTPDDPEAHLYSNLRARGQGW